VVDKDEHPRPETTLEQLAKLKPFVRIPARSRPECIRVNDGAAALIVASEQAANGTA